MNYLLVERKIILNELSYSAEILNVVDYNALMGKIGKSKQVYLVINYEENLPIVFIEKKRGQSILDNPCNQNTERFKHGC